LQALYNGLTTTELIVLIVMLAGVLPMCCFGCIYYRCRRDEIHASISNLLAKKRERKAEDEEAKARKAQEQQQQQTQPKGSQRFRNDSRFNNENPLTSQGGDSGDQRRVSVADLLPPPTEKRSLFGNIFGGSKSKEKDEKMDIKRGLFGSRGGPQSQQPSTQSQSQSLAKSKSRRNSFGTQ
jgi:hypothetical protein